MDCKGKMEYLWAPWRMEYIKIANEQSDRECPFCVKPAESLKKDKENLILFRGEKGFIMMNKFPYNGGHLLVLPYRHVKDISALNPEERIELMNLLDKSIQVLQKAFKPHGFNIGMNLGRVAGAGIADHLHFHVVPRWNGDTNFMPLISNTKVISSGLEETWETLRANL